MSTPDELILGNLIANRVESDPDRGILTFVDVTERGGFEEQTRTYRELWDNAQRIARALIDAGMAPGDRFAIMIQNHAEFVDAMIASSIVNTVFVPIDPRTQGAKLRYMLDFAGCRGVLTATYVMPQLLAVLPSLPELRWIWVIGDEPSADLPPQAQRLGDVLGPRRPDLAVAARNAADPMQMLYTSGTTGDPKAILAPYARFGQVASMGPLIGLRDDDRPYTGLSLTHANAQLITLGNVLKMGTPGVFSRRFTKCRLWDITRRYGCTVFNLLGGMTTAIYSEPLRPDDADNPVRYVLSAGMPAAIWEAFSRRFGVEILEFYGTAEGGLTINPPGVGPIGSIGKPPPTMIAKIVDGDGNECPPGTEGELLFRNADGSCPPVSYFRNPEASAEKVAGGWFHSGDICRMDAQGWIYFLYRKGTAIRRNGDFVNPAFVEKELAEHASVDDVFVYGVPAANGVPGEKDVVAAIVLRQGSRPDTTVAALFGHCHSRLERNFVPTYIQLMDEIPKTASEKPMERLCVDAFRRDVRHVYTDPASARPQQ